MTPDERTEAEVRADRALRRGELSSALALYQAIATAFPSDELVQVKLRRIRENLQPMELSHAKTKVPIDQGPPPTNSIQSAEALAAVGDYAGAIALYRKALEKRPDSDLIRERLAELFQIAQAIAPRATPGAATATASTQVNPPPSRPAAGAPPAGAATAQVSQPLSHSAAGTPPAAATPARVSQPLSHPAAGTPPRGAPGSSSEQAPVSTARLLSDLLDQISRRRRSPTRRG